MEISNDNLTRGSDKCTIPLDSPINANRILFTYDDNNINVMLNDPRGIPFFTTSDTDMFKKYPQDKLKIFSSGIITSTDQVVDILLKKRKDNSVDFLTSPILKEDLSTENFIVSSFNRYLRQIDRGTDLNNNVKLICAMERFNINDATGKYERCIILFFYCNGEHFIDGTYSLADKFYPMSDTSREWEVKELFNKSLYDLLFEFSMNVIRGYNNTISIDVIVVLDSASNYLY